MQGMPKKAMLASVVAIVSANHRNNPNMLASVVVLVTVGNPHHHR